MHRRRHALLLAVIGLALLAHPLYLFPHYGEAAHIAAFERVPAADVPDGATVVGYDDLPPAAQAHVRDDRDVLYERTDAAALDALRRADYVRRGGEHYRVQMGHWDDPGFAEGVVRLALTLVGGALVAVGGLAAAVDRVRPAGSLDAAWYPAAVGGGFAVSQSLGAGEPSGFSTTVGVGLLVFGVAPAVVGAAAKRRDRAAGVAGLVVLAAGLTSGVVFVWGAPVVAVVAVGISAVTAVAAYLATAPVATGADRAPRADA